jgi:small-conductance mechanosensitive channel
MAGDLEVMRILNEHIDGSRIVLIVAAAWVLTWLTARFFPWLAAQAPGRLRLYIAPSAPAVRLLILLAAVALIIPLVIKLTPQNALAILGAAGLAIGFAFKDYISSLVAGVVAIYERPYRPGDWVQIDGAYGEVQALGMRALRLVTPDDTVVSIPHAKIWTTNVYNTNNGNRDLMCVADFYLHPQHNAARVRQTLADVALTSPFLNLERPVAVILSEQPWGTHYQLKAYPIDGRDQFQFISDLTVRGKAALAKLGVEPAVAVPAVAAKSAHAARP